MQTQDFAKFVASQQESGEAEVNGEQVNWAGIRDEWIADLESLYGRIAEYLKEFVDRGSIRYEFTEVTLTEENIGTYAARRMHLHIGRQHIFLEPIGTLLIACKGRVDAVGFTGRAQLMLVNKDAHGAADLISVSVGARVGGSLPLTVTSNPVNAPEWKIVSRGLPKRFVELNKENFFDLLTELAGA